MKAAIPILVAALAAIAAPASAEVAGSWRVAGKVAAFAFTLDCDFKPDGARLGGVCVDASTNDPKIHGGRSHGLTAGAINGDRITWTYGSSFLFTKFDVTFDGVQTGDRMSGVIHVQGHDGAFTAMRQ